MPSEIDFFFEKKILLPFGWEMRQINRHCDFSPARGGGGGGGKSNDKDVERENSPPPLSLIHASGENF